jgi:hypothetical protein
VGRVLAAPSVVCVTLLLALVGSVASPSAAGAAGPAAAAGSPKVTVTPTSALHDGQTVTVDATGLPAGATLLAVECSPRALSIGEDGCENHRDAVFFADRAGDAVTTLVVTSKISTAVGTKSCITASCLLGVVRFTSPTADEIVGVAGLSFTSSTCHDGTSCEDAPPVPTTSVAGTKLVTAGRSWTRRGSTYTAAVTASLAGNLRSPSAITGPYRPRPSSDTRTTAEHATSNVAQGATSTRGEGLVQLSMDAPGTSWASDTTKAVVVAVRVDQRHWQQIVLFDGSRPFTYAGFTGPLSTGRHHVAIRVDANLSTTGRRPADVRLYRVRLSVVAPDNPMYLLEKYAPVVYGRDDSASSDTQLLTYGTATSLGGGSTQLAYETIWSHEDAGTSFVPFLEWGEWGRMTDITATVSLDVSSSGTISDPMYNWCGCGPHFQSNRDSLQEVSVPFHGHYVDGTHMVVRNASGNDYQSDVGTTDFRFQQPAVPGPAPGAERETVMDRHPWTYRVMEQEVRYWYLDRSTRPTSGQPGSARQYAIVSLDTSSAGVSSVAVDLRLSGSATWYRSDQGSGAPLFTGGQGRTVVKLPVDWLHRSVTGAQLRVYPASAAASLTVSSFHVLGLTSGFHVVPVSTPVPKVLPGRITTPPPA